MSAPPTPDKAWGLFETLLVASGEPVELEAHLERLSTSLGELYETALPAGLREQIVDRADGIGLGRMRVDVRPDERPTGMTLASEAVDPLDFFPDHERGAELRGVRCDGGLGPYKWADRRWLDRSGAGRVPLLLDRSEEVLEAARANVFVAVDSVLVTPPTDGRILPGTTRAAAIAVAREAGIELDERPLRHAELLAADEVFLTGSVRGVEPVRTLDGAALAPAGELSRLVGDGLRRRWLDAPAAIAGPAPAAAPPPGRLAR